MCPACQPPPIRDRKLNHDTLAMARVFQQTASLMSACFHSAVAVSQAFIAVVAGVAVAFALWS
jgi:hypothetical protein